MDMLTYIKERADSDGPGNGYNGYGNGPCNGQGYGNGYGDGYGNCHGNCHGNGQGYGNGYGDCGNGYGYGGCGGNGYGNGSGSCYGYSNGYGRGIAEIDGAKCYDIDGVPTFLQAVYRTFAKGFTLKQNAVKVPCYVALAGSNLTGYATAHGETLHEAVEAANNKLLEQAPLKDRIAEFVRTHPDLDKEYGDLFRWHHTLTGSCEFGRRQWCEQHGLKPTDSITLRRFIGETLSAYGGEVIKQLAEAYGLRDAGEEAGR